jgi:hypothetical protein
VELKNLPWGFFLFLLLFICLLWGVIIDTLGQAWGHIIDCLNERFIDLFMFNACKLFNPILYLINLDDCPLFQLKNG